MTYRDFLSAVLSMSTLSDDARAYAEGEVATLDARNAKRRNTLTKEQVANADLSARILAYVGENPNAVASTIAAQFGVTTQKVSALCGLMVKGGQMTVCDVKVKGKGSVKGYTAVTDGTTESDEDSAESGD